MSAAWTAEDEMRFVERLGAHRLPGFQGVGPAYTLRCLRGYRAAARARAHPKFSAAADARILAVVEARIERLATS